MLGFLHLRVFLRKLGGPPQAQLGAATKKQASLAQAGAPLSNIGIVFRQPGSFLELSTHPTPHFVTCVFVMGCVFPRKS